ncbi:hypothetical protein D3C75_1209820 [compost metagenome]
MVQVQAAGQADRIRLGKASDIRVIEAEQVVVQPGLAIQVLTLEPEVLLLDEMRLAHFLQGIAPDLIPRLPQGFASVFGQLLG